LDFESNYEVTVTKLRGVRSAANGTRRLRRLLFHELKHISPSAALVLASEVDCWNQKVGGKLKADIDSWHPDVKVLLCQMGYFELLGIERPSDQTINTKTVFLQFKRGQVGEGNGGELARQLRKEIEVIVGEKIKKHLLFEGLSEAITNAGQHAYRQRDSQQIKQWWLSGSYDKENHMLSVMFYDHGVGIPATLPSWKLFEKIKTAFHSWNDSQKIEAAMEAGRSSTGLSERGKGLQNFIEFAQAYEEGALSIYSSKGLYRMNFSKSNPALKANHLRSNFPESINGTLIEWSVRIK
jgi:hypothetical protein